MAVFARHGLRNLLEKIGLDKLLTGQGGESPGVENFTLPQRIRMSFEELGPAFVKFGQLLASRPDLITEEFVNEFEILHDKVNPLSFDVIDQVLKEEFGNNLGNIFSSIDPAPLGSASIAQVHGATLKDGTAVVLKVQRPGIIQVINDDLNVLYLIAELLEKYIPEVRSFNPVGVVNEYFKTLELETNFVVEANNIRRFQENFKNEKNVHIPKVFFDWTTSRVLVMEKLQGIPLTNEFALRQSGVIPEDVIKLGLRSYLKMVFMDGFFHGDLHAGNFFVYPQNEIGLIDFGVVGRLNSRTQNAIVNMLIALSKEDYDRMAFEYVELAHFSERTNLDAFAKDLRELIAPYYGLSLKHVNIGKLLLASSGVAARHHLVLPSELVMFFKSIVSIEGIGQKIHKDFDFLKFTLNMVNEVVKSQLEPTKWAHELSLLFRESRSVLLTLPRQLNLVMRRLSSPEYANKIRIDQLDDIKRSIELSFNLLFLGVIIAALILSSSIIAATHRENDVAGLPLLSFIGIVIAGLLSFFAFINYIRK